MKTKGTNVSRTKNERSDVYNRMKFLFGEIQKLRDNNQRLQSEMAILYYIHKTELQDTDSIIANMQQEYLDKNPEERVAENIESVENIESIENVNDTNN